MRAQRLTLVLRTSFEHFEYYPDYYNWATVDYMVNAADSRGMGPSLVASSTPPRETLPECLRRLVAAGRRVSRLGTRPT